jgi:hypothetical protein
MAERLPQPEHILRVLALPQTMARDDAPTHARVDDGVDVSLIRWMLSLSADERLAVLQGFADSVAAVTDDSTRT